MDKMALKHIMQPNPQHWTVCSILEDGYGSVLMENNRSVCLKVTDFYFVEGVFDAAFADELCARLSSSFILTSSNAAWYAHMAKKKPAKEALRQMYIWRANADAIKQLAFYRAALKPGYAFQAIGPVEMTQIENLDWASGVFDSYRNAGDYLERGFGYCIKDAGKVVSLCTSFSASKEGVEIEVDTDPAYQGQGLAKSVSACFVHEAYQRGMAPLWDATNAASVKIAEALGFSFIKRYTSLIADDSVL